jgi:hypothetical protein
LVSSALASSILVVGGLAIADATPSPAPTASFKVNHVPSTFPQCPGAPANKTITLGPDKGQAEVTSGVEYPKGARSAYVVDVVVPSTITTGRTFVIDVDPPADSKGECGLVIPK